MKILVVDDEPLAAQYIVSCIKQSGSDSDVIGYATSGQKALELLAENPADLVFTDITMPRMNGIELLSEIKSRWPLTDVIILTCHESFDYVRIAMDKRAANYVLKTEMSPEKAKMIIEDVRQDRIGKHTENVDIQLSRNRFLFLLLQNEFKTEYLTEETLRKNHILLENKAYEVLVFFKSENDLNHLSSIFGHSFSNLQYIVYESNNIFLLANLSEDRSVQPRYSETGSLRKYADKLNGLYGVSRMHNNTLEIRESLLEALESRDIYFYRNSAPQTKSDFQPFSEQMTSRILIMLDEGRTASACGLISEFLDRAEENRLRTDLLMEACIGIFRKLSNISKEVHEEDIQRLYSFTDFDSYRKYVEKITDAISGEFNRYSKPIQNALEYIEEHYAEDISLNSAADFVFLHRDYLSRQFKKEVGINFSEYLINIRLNHAKELLESTTMRISDISISVGIPNLSYFSTLFSKKFGRSPASFRSGR